MVDGTRIQMIVPCPTSLADPRRSMRQFSGRADPLISARRRVGEFSERPGFSSVAMAFLVTQLDQSRRARCKNAD